MWKPGEDTPAIDMDVVRHACALVHGVRTGRPELHLEAVGEFARADPDALASLVVVLACMANEDLTRPDRLLDLLLDTGLDMSAVWRDAHRTYEKLRSERRAHKAPSWVVAGERIYQRLRHQRRRASRQEVA